MQKRIYLGKKSSLPEFPNNFKLDTIENKTLEDYLIRITVPEFTSICPVTSQPDFAVIIIDYSPKKKLVESKSLKLYMNSFRNIGIFHEEVTCKIGQYLHKSLKPKWIRISGFFAPRGGIPIDIFWQKGKANKSIFVPPINAKEINKLNRYI